MSILTLPPLPAEKGEEEKTTICFFSAQRSKFCPMIKKQRLNRKSNGVDFPSIYICHVRTRCICTPMAENYQKMLYTPFLYQLYKYPST